MSRAPRIGITTYGRHGDGRLEGRFHLPAKYVDSVRRAGGLPVLLPPGEEDLDGVLALVDALVLTGGPDVEPALYGGSAHPQVYGVDPERDRMELELVRAAVRGDVPTLGICRGCQVINVALGGTLIEHLPDVVGENVLHRGPDRDYVPHRVHVETTSKLAAVLGTPITHPASSHHQAIRRPAQGLAVVARAPDGTIEAVEMPRHPWLVAVQWHPEQTSATDPTQQRLFDALVAEVRGARGAARGS
jgi:putative glutamine amidotransferase